MKRKVRYLQTAPEMIETAQSGHSSGPGINWHRPQAGRKPDFRCVPERTPARLRKLTFSQANQSSAGAIDTENDDRYVRVGQNHNSLEYVSVTAAL